MSPALALVGLAAAALAALVVVELRPADPAGVPSAARPAVATAAPAPVVSSRTASIDKLLTRPLFSHTRRPSDAAAAPAAEAAPAAALPRMTGILIDGPHRSAIFAAPGGKPAIVAEGGRVGPFTIETITPQQVVVLGPEGKRVVRTSFDPNPPPPVPALTSIVASPQFPGIALPGVPPITTPITTPGGRLPGGPQFPPGPAGAGYGAAR